MSRDSRQQSTGGGHAPESPRVRSLLSFFCLHGKAAPKTKKLKHVPLAVLLALLAVVGCDPDEPVVIIGHRGAPLEELENSLAGFQRARERGADGIELDVVYTADGRNIVMHDLTMERTTDCEGAVSGYTLSTLSACRLDNGEPIRTLEQVLATVGPWFEYIFVEVKAGDRLVEQTDAAVDTVLSSGFASRVILNSLTTEVEERLASRSGEGIVVSWDELSGSGVEEAARRHLPWHIVPIDLVDPRVGIMGEGLGVRVMAYDVHTSIQYRKAHRAGIRVMMSDSILTLRALSGR